MAGPLKPTPFPVEKHFLVPKICHLSQDPKSLYVMPCSLLNKLCNFSGYSWLLITLSENMLCVWHPEQENITNAAVLLSMFRSILCVIRWWECGWWNKVLFPKQPTCLCDLEELFPYLYIICILRMGKWDSMEKSPSLYSIHNPHSDVLMPS